MISLLLAAAALAVVLTAGGFPRRTAAAAVVGGAAGAFLAGSVLLHLVLTLFDRIGLRWGAAPVLAAVLVLALAWRRLGAAPPDRLESPARSGSRAAPWGLLVAALPVAIYGILAARGWAQGTDFVYHWGLKARRFLLAGGIDSTLLARPDTWRIHADYPQAVPELLGLPGLLAGRFDEAAALLLTVAVAGLTALALRAVLSAHGVDGFLLEAGTAIGACATAGFGFAFGVAGMADGFLALALLAGVAGLLRIGEPAGQATLGWAAALAAAAKIEGVPLAGVLVAAALLRRRRGRSAGELARLAVPAALVVLPWWLDARERLSPTNAGALRADELGTVLARFGATALAWGGGFWPLALLLLPWVARSRRLRAAAAVVAAQLGIYVVLYLVSPLHVDRLIATTGVRLLSHLVPAALLLVLLRAAEAVYPQAPETPAATERARA